MTNKIPLGKLYKYALQEEEALQEELKDKTLDYFSGVITEEELDEVGADFDRAAEEVSELKFLLDEATKLEILEQNHIDLIAAKFHEWTTQMNCAFEEGFFDIK
jgi:hypothetical protein